MYVNRRASNEKTNQKQRLFSARPWTAKRGKLALTADDIQPAGNTGLSEKADPRPSKKASQYTVNSPQLLDTDEEESIAEFEKVYILS